MTGYKRVNYYELCRLCTSSQQKDKIHIFRDEGKKMQLQQKIQSCFPLLVNEHDYLPKVVCMSCIQILDQCFNFRQGCVNSEAMLSSYFSNFRFTDDFKKNGQVYVKDIKDTGQKQNSGETLPIIEKKNSGQECTVQNINVIPSPIRDIPQQCFNLELPPLSQTATLKLLTTTTNTNSTIKTNNFQTPLTNVPQIPKPKESPLRYQSVSSTIPNTINSNTNMLTTCNLTAFNFNTNNLMNVSNNNNIKTNFEQTSKNIEQISTEINNVLKNNINMFIDMEQLMETGIENEASKLREALMKPKDKKVIEKDDKIDVTQDIKSEPNEVKEKVFKCDVCEKTFKRREHLYQHSKLHSGVRPFSCTNCTKTFSRKEHLMRHLTSHSGVKDFSCDVCNKRFSRPDNLKKHKKTHQKSPFRCEICTKNFIIKHYYVAHMQAHQNGENLGNNVIGNMMKIENNI